MAMALDEPNDNDLVYDIDGFQYVVNKEFIDQIKPVKVDFKEYGFDISAGVSFAPACGGGCSTDKTCH